MLGSYSLRGTLWFSDDLKRWPWSPGAHLGLELLLLGTKLVSSVEVESSCVAWREIPAGGEVAG